MYSNCTVPKIICCEIFGESYKTKTKSSSVAVAAGGVAVRCAYVAVGRVGYILLDVTLFPHPLHGFISFS